MAWHNGEQSTELLHAQAHVWNHILNFINSMSLECATQLGIPDIIHKHGKPMTLEELVDALPINKAKSQGVSRLMRILMNLGYRSGFDRAMASSSEWFENENPTPFDTKHGKTFWEYAGQEPRLNNFFNEAMASDAKLVASVLISDCKHLFEGLNSIVDVGGGTGTVSEVIVDAFPNLKCTVPDLPHVVAGL
ncbi:unnamed protein product [Fraxinus pennsylvanica]|uniref:Uncharacterized protein n=1 Tax=Fraxinus pennsylvanica TaxID=56036 RepID=A0AAD2AGK0_9LAMI|nr:unnamed protein product [Fraxinus pennsylvanica]